MRLTDEEKDMLAGKFGPVPKLALEHQIAVGDFFGAQDFVAVSQAHIMADTESLGEAGVRPLERLAGGKEGRSGVGLSSITGPRWSEFAKDTIPGDRVSIVIL